MNISTLSQLYAYAEHKHVRIFKTFKNTRFYAEHMLKFNFKVKIFLTYFNLIKSRILYVFLIMIREIIKKLII
jgi:hypothetical protein